MGLFKNYVTHLLLFFDHPSTYSNALTVILLLTDYNRLCNSNAELCNLWTASIIKHFNIHLPLHFFIYFDSNLTYTGVKIILLESEMKLVRKWHHQFWNIYKGHDLSISLLGSIGEPWFSTGIVKTFITLISNFCTTSILGAIYSLYKVLPLLVTILAVNPMMPNQWNKISTKNSINQLEQAASCSFKPKSICLSNPKLKNKQKMNNVFANWNLIKKTKGTLVHERG